MKSILLLIFAFILATSAQAQLTINEFMADNQTATEDEDQSNDDWIEIFNAGNSDVNLDGYCLTDDIRNLRKFRLKANAKQQLIAPAHGYLIVWCDEDQLEGPQHCNFKLNAKGEFIALIGPDSKIVDSISFVAQLPDISFGRTVDGNGDWNLLALPTPNHSNNGIGKYGSSTACARFYSTAATELAPAITLSLGKLTSTVIRKPNEGSFSGVNIAFAWFVGSKSKIEEL